MPTALSASLTDTAPPAPLQSGRYVFVFTDLVNSTYLTFTLPSEQWRPARDAFFALQDDLSRRHQRLWLSPRGDGKFLVFEAVLDAVQFAAALLCAVAEADWGGIPIGIRVGIASGHADFLPTEAGGVTEDFIGAPLNLASRVCGVARPGEALLASAARTEAQGAGADGLDFADLGEVELKGLPLERLFRLVAPGLPQDFPPLARRGNLERHRSHSAYFGREQTLTDAIAALAGARPVLTVLGDPGQGKTRLALEVGRQAQDQFSDGVWFVPLEHVRQGDLVAEAVATALDLTAQAGRGIGDVVLQHLKPRQSLLILDNCEQLLAAGDGDPGLLDFVEDVSRSCPRVRVLATSRVPLELGVSLEQRLRLPDLPVPPAEKTLDMARLRQCPSVALLCDRLHMASGGQFVLDEAAAPHVISLCRSLDGVPLYLELAAGQLARARTLPQIAADVYKMLQTRDRDVADRQRTLDALLDFSCDLLPDERDFFHRLGVFSGSFQAEDAAAVCGQSDAEERLRTLALHSLVKSDAGDNYTAAAPRFRLLQAPAAYGRRRLGDDLTRWQRRHAEHYLAFARAQDARLKGPEQKAAADAMAEALPNLRAGMDWAAGEDASRMAGEYGAALGRFLFIRSLTTEGRSRMAAALEEARRAGDAACEACALSWAATFERQSGGVAAARVLEEQALVLWRAVGDRSGEAASRNALGVIEESRGDHAAARAHALDALALFHDLGDLWGEAQCLYHLGEIELHQGITALAFHYYQQSFALRERIGDRRGLGNSLSALGRIAFSGADYEQSRTQYERALHIKRELADQEGEATCLYTLGIISQATGDAEAAWDQLHAAMVTYQRLGLRAHEADCLRRAAEIALGRSDSAQAREASEKALLLFREMNDLRGTASALMMLAQVAGAAGNHAEALRLAREALQIRRQLNLPDRVAESLFVLGTLLRDGNAPEEALRHFGDSLRTFHAQGRRHGIATVLSGCGALFERAADARAAFLLFHTACALFRDLGVKPDQSDYREAEVSVLRLTASVALEQAAVWEAEADALGVEGAVALVLARSGTDV